MRYYLEEQADIKWESIRKYILDIRDYTSEALLDEIIKNIQRLNPDSRYPFDPAWIKDYKEYEQNESKESLIASALEERFYVFNDNEEHAWNMKVVREVMDGGSWIHRWNNQEYK